MVGQSRREKARREQGKVFHDYVIVPLNLKGTSVHSQPVQFIPTSASSRGMSSARQSQLCADGVPRAMDWPPASLAACRGLARWIDVTLVFMWHPVDIQAVRVESSDVESSTSFLPLILSSLILCSGRRIATATSTWRLPCKTKKRRRHLLAMTPKQPWTRRPPTKI